MLCIAKPTQELVSEFLEKQKYSKLSYNLEKGTLYHSSKKDYSSDERFKIFDVDEHSVKLGSGENCFVRAVAGLKAWKHFNMSWVEVCFPDTPIQGMQL